MVCVSNMILISATEYTRKAQMQKFSEITRAKKRDLISYH